MLSPHIQHLNPSNFTTTGTPSPLLNAQTLEQGIHDRRIKSPLPLPLPPPSDTPTTLSLPSPTDFSATATKKANDYMNQVEDRLASQPERFDEFLSAVIYTSTGKIPKDEFAVRMINILGDYPDLLLGLINLMPSKHVESIIRECSVHGSSSRTLMKKLDLDVGHLYTESENEPNVNRDIPRTESIHPSMSSEVSSSDPLSDFLDVAQKFCDRPTLGVINVVLARYYNKSLRVPKEELAQQLEHLLKSYPMVNYDFLHQSSI